MYEAPTSMNSEELVVEKIIRDFRKRLYPLSCEAS